MKGKRMKHKESKKKALIDLCFLLGVFLVILSFYVALVIRGQKSNSVAENRALNKIPAFSLASFFKGEYQTKLEDSLIDQMVFSEKIKKEINKQEAQTVTGMQTFLANAFNYGDYDGVEDETEEQTTVADNKNSENQNTQNNEQSDNNKETENTQQPQKEVRKIKYVSIGGGDVYHYGNSEYMVFKCKNLEKSKSAIKKWADSYNKHFKGLDTYFYLVNTSKSINFNTVDETENEFVTYIRSVLNFKDVQGLKISSYDQYKDYFYQTDHHWNYKGSYQGYRDIIQMMLPEDKLIEPKKTVTYDVYYYGSNARTTSVYTNKEKFTVYKFDIKRCNTIINGSYARYDNEYLYENGTYSKEEGYNHYRAYYGGDYAEVIYERENPKKENLLIIAPSYSNANNNLISTHFNNTYVIDLRHYYNTYGKQFNADEYCKKHNITKVLVMLSIDHITNGGFILK